ncbi:hypothetical protein LSUE1_G004046 [Lachnellula suecica]|uniref:3'-5' exoribonuclease Rv2179c-like domain-containing protein n=1 Tax=Lachnellula suecica TaxID=602035 RepID=A0A8T9CF17_9HELO|nr:hypothetical protein LSUE1_G004046 [Lachnellula suecica]
MGKKNFHTNIMLDLECAAINVYNPAIIEIAAIFFDPHTGEELDYFTTPVNLESSEKHGLVVQKDTVEIWLPKNIPETLQISKTTSITLPEALQKFSDFIANSHKATNKELMDRFCHEDSQVMIWGNGSASDNVWIDSAYTACNMTRPWKHYNNTCVRTFVKQCAFMTGRDFSREIGRRGAHHVALEDCKHQILYLVKARNHLMPRPQPVKRQLPTPEFSFSGKEGDNDFKNPAAKRVNHERE